MRASLGNCDFRSKYSKAANWRHFSNSAWLLLTYIKSFQSFYQYVTYRCYIYKRFWENINAQISEKKLSFWRLLEFWLHINNPLITFLSFRNVYSKSFTALSTILNNFPCEILCESECFWRHLHWKTFKMAIPE